MGWVHDTGYEPAYTHQGYAAAVLDDGTDTGTHRSAMQDRVTGWRAACDCGWRGTQFWTRADYPGSSSVAPDEVQGFDSGRGAYAEWGAHLHTALPLLAVHDAIQDLDRGRARLDRAVGIARAASVPWSAIAAMAGMTKQSAHSRWSRADSAATTTIRDRRTR